MTLPPHLNHPKIFTCILFPNSVETAWAAGETPDGAKQNGREFYRGHEAVGRTRTGGGGAPFVLLLRLVGPCNL